MRPIHTRDAAKTKPKWPAGPWLAVCVAGLLSAGCDKADPQRYQGYIEAEPVRVAAPLAGSLEQLRVHRGEQVRPGQPLFDLECQAEKAARQEAFERLRQAQARAENLRKGRRPTEITGLEARLSQSQAALKLSESELARWEKLRLEKVVSAFEFDRAKTAFERDQHQVESLAADLATAKLGARDDEIVAAEAEVAAAQASLARAEWSVTQKQQTAPTNGLVQDTLYAQGEWVPAGSPIVVLLPPGNLKVRFFVPQARGAQVKIGEPVTVHMDGRTNGIPAKVSYVSPQTEFTPPVIYSQENRAKLVFMLEAVFDQPDLVQLHPGQPVEVKIGSTRQP